MGRSGIVAQFNTPTRSYDLDSAIHTFLNDSRIITLASEGDKLLKELVDAIRDIPTECRMHINPALSKIFYIIYAKAFYLYDSKNFRFRRISLTDEELMEICSKYSVAFNINDESTKSPFYNMYRDILRTPSRNINLISLRHGVSKLVSTFPAVGLNTDFVREERRQALFKILNEVCPCNVVYDRTTETISARIDYINNLVLFADKFISDYLNDITISYDQYSNGDINHEQ